MSSLNQTILFYDGTCGLCNRLVRFILRNERNNQISFCALQSDRAKVILGEERCKQLDTLYFLLEGVVYDKSSAALRVATFLKFPYRLFRVAYICPKIIRDKVYGLVAKTRYRWFGQSESCEIPSEANRKRFVC